MTVTKGGLSKEELKRLKEHKAVEDISYTEKSSIPIVKNLTYEGYVIEFSTFRAWKKDKKTKLDWNTSTVHTFLNEMNIPSRRVRKVKWKKAVIQLH